MAAVAEEPCPWLYMGYAGLGFALQQIAPVVGDVEDALGQVDAMIAAELAAPLYMPYELLGGVVGLGVYALERGLAPVRDLVVRFLSTRSPEGAWKTFDVPGQPPACPDGYYNLGLAHGVAGAIAFLGDAGAHDLAIDGLTWLRAREQPGPLRYPMMIGNARDYTLDGWCYGEPATAIAYVRAGLALGEPAWIEAGRALALVSARRTDAELAHVSIDAALCHGATGRAHLFARLADMLASDELHAAATRWHRHALAQLAAPDALATYKPGIQVGLAGIGLALLAATHDRDPAWDRMLLVSPAGPGRGAADPGSGTSRTS
jgi:lantibiotic biosynthesis protein